jgi:hypothetical protein
MQRLRIICSGDKQEGGRQHEGRVSESWSGIFVYNFKFEALNFPQSDVHAETGAES